MLKYTHTHTHVTLEDRKYCEQQEGRKGKRGREKVEYGVKIYASTRYFMLTIIMITLILLTLFGMPRKREYKGEQKKYLDGERTYTTEDTIKLKLKGTDEYGLSSYKLEAKDITVEPQCEVTSLSSWVGTEVENGVIYLITLSKFTGTGEVKITIGEGTLKDINGNESKEQTLAIGAVIRRPSTEWNGILQTPDLMAGMTPVYWEGTTLVKKGDENYDESKWYDYRAEEGTEDTKLSRWANAMTEDGSFWVWIPRYEYKITDEPTTDSGAGRIQVNFIKTEQEEPTQGYKIHPAFCSNVDAGGFGTELSGLWVAKFEMSQECCNSDNVWETTNQAGSR